MRALKCGSVGAGITYYAKKFTNERQATYCFGVDDTMFEIPMPEALRGAVFFRHSDASTSLN